MSERVTIYSKETGKPYNRFADVAAEMVASGEFTYDDPATPLPLPAPQELADVAPPKRGRK